MIVTPSSLFELAVRRHRQPWNWSLHCAALALFCCALLWRSYLALSAGAVLFGAGFFELNLGELPAGRWSGLVRRGVEWEKNWSAVPWTWLKWARLGFSLLVGAVLVWALWESELATLMLLACFAVLWRIRRENRESGIDP
ncbi:MAG: hypothetical protein AB7E51_11345 [Pseudodesulfovibrio sp.]|uniref:hypothetical protein n=1 Tax=Pseudodesulfovibrio sp. TaxID=2035812 RepID=UPI003D13D181